MRMYLDAVFFAAVVLYFLAMLLRFLFVIAKKEWLKKAAWAVFAAACAISTAYIVARGIIAGRVPMANQFEFATAFAWGLAAMLIVIVIFTKVEWLSLVGMPAVFLLISYAALLPNKEIRELMPALRSVWFGLHIGSAVFSYAAFALAGCVGIMYLIKTKQGEDESALLKIDYLSYRLVCFGFLMLTVVILSGCVWAEQAWSRFWSWDPKETWALITWVVYAIYLHLRFFLKWRGNGMAWFVIAAVVFVIFTFIGVNTLLPGLHSYG